MPGKSNIVKIAQKMLRVYEIQQKQLRALLFINNMTVITKYRLDLFDFFLSRAITKTIGDIY